MKTLILKRNEFWSEGREDYSALDGDRVIGRIYSGAGARADGVVACAEAGAPYATVTAKT
jgi:hypothetical protein